jgi:hypothetical protein
VVALGVTTEGAKIPLGLWKGSTENATVVTALLADLVERGLSSSGCGGRGRSTITPARSTILWRHCRAPAQSIVRFVHER